MAITFRKATKANARLRLALTGPSGSGKTYTALRLATGLVSPGGLIAVIDTERGSASKYADEFDFITAELGPPYSVERYLEALDAAAEAGAEVVVIDSFTHAWSGTGGVLDEKDRVAKRSRSGDSFGAWREVTPLHNSLVDAVLDYPGHVIATMRSKMAHEIVEDERGKKRVVKLGMAPIQRDGVEYEFDILADMTMDNELQIVKTRAKALRGRVERFPGEKLAGEIRQWLDGAQTVTAEGAAKLRALLGTIEDEGHRSTVLGEFTSRFGPPARVLASDAPEAEAWLAERVAEPAPMTRAEAHAEGDEGRGAATGSSQRQPMPNHKGPVSPGEYDVDGMTVNVEGPERDEAHVQLVNKVAAEAKRVKALAAEGNAEAKVAVELIRKILDGGQFRELSTRKLNQILAAVEEGTEPWPDEPAAPVEAEPAEPASEPSPADLEAEAAALASRRKVMPDLSALTGGDWIALAEQHLGLDASDFSEWLFGVFGDDLPDLAALAGLGPDQREVVYESIVNKVQPEGAAA